MPYNIVEDGDRWCVEKDDGERMGCHDSRAAAEAQQRALYAAEDKQLKRYTQSEVGYVPLSTIEGQACANCRWFASDVSMCHVMENYPLDVVATGHCAQWAALPVTDILAAHERIEAEGVELEDTEPVVAAEMSADAPPPEAAATLFAAPTSTDSSVFKALLDRLTGGLKPGTAVIKGADGKRYMLIVTSNAYKDREGETITSAALAADVDRCWIAEDQYRSDNPLLFWHDDRVVIGDIVWGDMRGPFLVEVARENNAPLARVVFDYREAHPEEKWGASHRFVYRVTDRTETGDYTRIIKRETSILPRAAAANLLTFSGVLPVSKARDEYLNKMLGLPNAADLLDQGIGALIAALDAAGVEHKSADEQPNTEDAVDRAAARFGTLMLDLVNSQADFAAELDAAKAMFADKAKALDDERAALEVERAGLRAEVDALKALAEQLQAQLNARPRVASKDDGNVVPDDTLTTEMRAALMERDPFWHTER